MAITSTDNSRFFGVDTSPWPRQWRAAGALLLELPLLRKLTPEIQVRLRYADGGSEEWSLSHGVATPVRGGRAVSPKAYAIELASDRVLERQLVLPPLAAEDLAQAVQLEVASISPFGADETVHGYAAAAARDGVRRVDVAITSRRQVDQAVAAAVADGFEPSPEVWVLPARAEQGKEFRPVVLSGFGEGARKAIARRGMWLRLGMLSLAAVLLAILMVTPTLLLRAQVQKASQSFAALQAQAAPQLAQREALMRRVERLQVIGQTMDSQLALPPVLDMLSRTIPDGAWLSQLRLDGSKLVLHGNADDAAALVQQFAGQPDVRDVRLASPATRGHGASKETFIIEMTLEPGRFGLVRRSGGAS